MWIEKMDSKYFVFLVLSCWTSLSYGSSQPLTIPDSQSTTSAAQHPLTTPDSQSTTLAAQHPPTTHNSQGTTLAAPHPPTTHNSQGTTLAAPQQPEYQFILAKVKNISVYISNKYGAEKAKFILGIVAGVLAREEITMFGNITIEKMVEAYDKAGLSSWNTTHLQNNKAAAAQLFNTHFDRMGFVQEIVRLSGAAAFAEYLPILKSAEEYLVAEFGPVGAQVVLGAMLKAFDSNLAHVVENTVIKNLADAYNKSDIESWNATYIQQHQNDLGQLIISNLDVLGTVGEIYKQLNTRVTLPLGQLGTSLGTSHHSLCYSDLTDVLDALLDMDNYPWAMSIFDATGKLPAGILKGKVSMLGSYDECREITATIPANVTLGNKTTAAPRYPRSFNTKYCRMTMTVDPAVFGNVDTKGVKPIVTLGLCMPQSCKAKEVTEMLYLGYLNKLLSVVSPGSVVHMHCDEPRYVGDDGSAVAAIVIIAIFAFLVLVGTLSSVINGMMNSSKTTLDDKMTQIKDKSSPNVYTDINKVKEDNGHYQTLSETTLTNGKSNGILGSNESHSNATGIGEGNGVISTADLPSGYMQHMEGDRYNPGAVRVDIGNLPDIDHKVNDSNKVNDYKVPELTRRKPPTQRHGTLYRFVTCFAVDVNAPKILSGKSGKGAITCLHGIRFCSITWIMLGHTYNYGMVKNPGVFTMANFVDAIPMIQRFTYQAVSGAGYAVDTFYMISGMLLTYIQIKQMLKIKEDPKPDKVGFYVFYYYFHRFWRLTPMYMAVLMIYACLYPYFGNGPMWPESIDTADNCKTYWWTNLLYINNLVEVKHMCMGWSWFLANDMQFYVVSIIILFSLTMNIKFGSLIIFLLMAAGIASAGWKEYIYNGSFFTMQSDGGAFWNNVYITPWCRVAAFCVGMLLGVIMYKNPKLKLPKAAVFIGWCFAFALGLALVYCTYSENRKGGKEWSKSFRAAYESLGRPLWASCVAWVVLTCHHGYGGIVNIILSWKGFVPLSRLSYAAYLVHPVLMMVYAYSKRNLIYLSDYEVIYMFLGHTVMTFMVAFVVSLMFEAPFMSLEKLMMRNRK